MNRLAKAAQCAIIDCLQAQPQESLLIVAQNKQLPIAQVFQKVAEKAKLQVFVLQLPNSHEKRPFSSAQSRSLISAADKVLVLSPEFDVQSINWLRRQKHSKVVLWPLLEEETILRCTSTDWKKIRERCRKLADILTIGRNLSVVEESGTTIEMSINQRKGTLEAIPLDNEFCYSSIPSGRAYALPVPNSANGEIKLDRIAGYRLSSPKPIIIKVKDGRLRQIRGDKHADHLRQLLKARPGARKKTAEGAKRRAPNGRRVVEIGFGLNDNARLGQEVLEDEKVLGTIHLGFGRRLGQGKGVEVLARGIIVKPTVAIDGRAIIRQGQLLID